MKYIIKLLCLLVSFSVLFAMTGCIESGEDVEQGTDYELQLEGDYNIEALKGTTINVFNWGEYIPDGTEGSMDINKKFTEVTGIKVNYTTYENNESMYAKLKSGGVSYDIVIPSDYMIERMVRENMLEKLEMDRLSNYKYIDRNTVTCV